MSNDVHDFSAEELLERNVRTAMLEKDWPRAKSLLQAQPLTNDFKGSVLSTAVQMNAPEIVRFVFEEEKITLAPETGMMFLLTASKEKHRDMAVYLCERIADLGLTRADPYALLFDKFPADEHVPLIDAVLAEAADKQDSLNKMLYAAADTKNFGVIPALVDKGASVNADTATLVYTMLKGFPADDAEKQKEYDAAFAKVLAADVQDKSTLDTALVVAAMQHAEGKQSENVIRAMLQSGADPFTGAREAERIIIATVTPAPDAVLDKNGWAAADAVIDGWRDTFKTAQQADTQKYASQFDAFFGNDYRPADLLAPVGDDGDTGLMIAAKAQKLGDVIFRAQKTGDTNITFADITRANDRQQTVLSLAVDRGDLAALMQPAYWLKQEPQLLQKIDATLTAAQKETADLSQLSADVRQQQLREKASRLRLAPRPNPAFAAKR